MGWLPHETTNHP